MWSPNGQKIAFTRSLVRREGDKVVGVDFDVYVINADGSEERNLTGDAQSFEARSGRPTVGRSPCGAAPTATAGSTS